MDERRGLPRESAVIQAWWARIGKDPGTREDFSVLAASAAGIDIGELAVSYVAGVPSPDMDMALPSAPPWVTFGVHDSAAGRLVSIAIQRPWEGVDQAGRPIWPRDFFAVRYSDLAGYGVTYQDLHEAVKDIDLRQHDGTARLSIQPRPAQEPTSSLFQGFNLGGVIAIATALLDGPVAVTGTSGLYLPDRLRLLDAVAALLPYGYRGDLSASTAVSGGSLPAMRLVFTERPSESQQMTDLRRPIRPQGPFGASYLRTLDDKGESKDLQEILGYLWQDKSAQSFASADGTCYAVSLLSQLDWENDLIKGIRKPGPVDPGLASEFFRQDSGFVQRWWPLLSDKQAALVEAALRPKQQESTPPLIRHWDTVVPAIMALANERLDRADVAFAERSMAVAAHTRSSGPADALKRSAEQAVHRADGLLSRLMLSSGDGPSMLPWAQRMLPRIRLLTSQQPERMAGYAETREFLRLYGPADGPAQLMFRLLTNALKEDVVRARSWAAWLCSPVPIRPEALPAGDWAIALDTAVRGSHGIDHAGSLVDTVQVAPAWTAPLVQLSRLFGHQAAVLKVLANEIVRQAFYDPAEAGRPEAGRSIRQALAAALDEPFRPGAHEQHLSAAVPEDTLARLDAARALLGLRPRDFPLNVGRRADLEEYLSGLEAVLAWVAEVAADGDSLLQARFQDELVWTDPDSRGPLPRGAIFLIRDWCRDDRRVRALARHIETCEGGAVADALWKHGQLLPEDWDLLGEHVQQFKKYGSQGYLRLAVQRAIADPGAALHEMTVKYGPEQEYVAVQASDLARAIYNAWVGQTSLAESLNIIRGVRVRDDMPYAGRTLMDRVTPVQFWTVLARVESLMAHHRDDVTDVRPGYSLEQPRAVRDRLPKPLRQDRAESAEREWLQALLLIGWGNVLGEEYAKKFRLMAVSRSADGTEVYDFIQRVLGAKKLGSKHDSLLVSWTGMTSAAFASIQQKNREHTESSGTESDVQRRMSTPVAEASDATVVDDAKPEHPGLRARIAARWDRIQVPSGNHRQDRQ